jgi:hypothetical protein
VELQLISSPIPHDVEKDNLTYDINQGRKTESTFNVEIFPFCLDFSPVEIR